MKYDDMIGQVYERPGTETGQDHWEVVAVSHDKSGPLVILRSRDGERVTLSLRHLREPYWRQIGDSEDPDLED